MNRKYRFIVTIMIVIFIISFISCKKESEKAKETVETIFAVNTTKTIKGEINNYIELNGDVKTKTEIDVYPDVTGKLISIRVSLGQNVLKNQIIAYVDPSKPGMDYKPNPVKSTITGTITSLPIKIGSTVTQQIAIAKIGKLNQLEVVTFVSEKYISKIKIGLLAIIKTQAYDKKINAFISETSPVVDPLTRMMEVKLNLYSQNRQLMPGMFVEIKIITEKKNNIVKIPAECVVKRYGNYYVFVIKRTKDNEAIVERKKIRLGIQIENKIEITDGLKENEEIVFRGQTLLEDKSRVRIIETLQPLTREDIIE